MKRRLFACLLLASLALAVSIQPARTASDGWQPITPGIDYQQFLANGPNDVFVARMDRSNPDLTLETMSAYGKLSGGRETISKMAQRYDEAINYWGENWGNRSKVVVAINGDFELPDLAVPARGQVISGWYARRFADKENGSGFVWTLDRQAFVGECISHPVNRQVAMAADSTPLYIQGVNVARGDNQIILYTPQYDATTRTAGGVEVLIEIPTPAMILPNPANVTGIVKQVRSQGSTPIPFDHVVLSGSGDMAQKLKNHVFEGETIRISQELRHFSEDDCITLLPDLTWTRSYASLGGSFYFLKNGKLQHLYDSGANVRNPRTAIAFNDQYIFFIVVDGRNTSSDANPGVSVGMTMDELGRFARDTLGATYGINQDGGGSSEMVVNGMIVNTPSDGLKLAAPEAANTNAVFLPMIGKGFQGNTWTPPYTGPKVERAVVNGLMMVVVETRQQSSNYAAGIPVITLGETTLRLGPGSNYAGLTTLPAGSTGVVSTHNLNGVLARGSYWWKVDFAGTVGWVPEEVITH